MNIAGKTPASKPAAGTTGGIIFFAGCSAAAVALAVTTALFMSRTAAATPAFATQTGKSCVTCHTSAEGGALTAFGEKFKADGNKLPAEAAK